jgi:8-oxo-dGTP diphosphatase
MSNKTAEGHELLDDVSNYDKDKYEKPSVTVDICICTIDDGQLKVLMIKRKHPPFRGCYACPGGFLDLPKRESLEKTALRELKEETSVKGIPVHQLYTYGDVNRDPRMRVITVAYYACVDSSVIKVQNIKAADDASEYCWMNLKDVPKLAFDHNKILRDLYIRLQSRVTYSDLAFQFLPNEFTWTQLQNVYEIVLDRKLVAPNFRRKIMSLYDLEETGNTYTPNKGRPSRMFRFKGIKEVFV